MILELRPTDIFYCSNLSVVKYEKGKIHGKPTALNLAETEQKTRL